MNPVVPIDLKKNPDVAALVADMEPGDKVYACFTIKSKDDQTLFIRLSEMSDTCGELEKSDDTESEAEDAGEAEPEEKPAEEPTPEKSRGEKMVDKMNMGMG